MNLKMNPKRLICRHYP